jgi:outer membrane autotransporter protein
MFTLGTAAKHVGKSKPTISKAIKDGKLSAKKIDGVYQIEPSELLRIFPVNAPQEAAAAPQSLAEQPVALALAEQQNTHLQAAVDDLRERLGDMKRERDQAQQDAREDRSRVVALLEDQRPKSMWSRIFNK